MEKLYYCEYLDHLNLISEEAFQDIMRGEDYGIAIAIAVKASKYFIYPENHASVRVISKNFGNIIVGGRGFPKMTASEMFSYIIFECMKEDVAEIVNSKIRELNKKASL